MAAVVEWLLQPSWTAALIALLFGAIAAVTLWRKRSPTTHLLAASLVLLMAALLRAEYRIDRIGRHWDADREDLVAAAYGRLAGDLHDALQNIVALARSGAEAADLLPEELFAHLASRVHSNGLETGIAVLEADGALRAWAGRLRFRPEIDAEGDSIAVWASRHATVLLTRRHLASGRVLVAMTLLWAHPAVVDADRSLANLFRARTTVDLQVFTAGTAPNNKDIFDYIEPTTSGPRLIFSVLPRPPSQGEAMASALAVGIRRVGWLVLATIGLALLCTTRPIQRYTLVAMVIWLVSRGPAAESLGLAPLFSNAVFFQTFLGPPSSSAGLLALYSVAAIVVSVAVWRLLLPRRWYCLIGGIALVLAAPYVMGVLGRGITLPSTGASIGLWIVWNVALFLCTSAILVGAAALLRGFGRPAPGRWRVATGALLGVLVAVIGIEVWTGRSGWPWWYTFLWTPSLVLVTLSAPRRATILGIAIVAGSAASLLTWRAELLGRIEIARADLATLGAEPNPLATPLLEHLGQQIAGNAPETSADLYSAWKFSAIRDQDYPVQLGLWTSKGEPLADLALDELDLRPVLVARLVKDMDSTSDRTIIPLHRSPGLHYLLLQRVAGAGTPKVVSVAVGPRSTLVAPARLGRLLDNNDAATTQYRLSLSSTTPDAPSGPALWRREGRSLSVYQRIELTEGPRLVHGIIDLGARESLFIRGALLLILDLAILALLWALAEFAAGEPFRLPPGSAFARSYQVQLSLTLGVFFIVPTAGYAAWEFNRLAAEAQRGRDLLIAQTLRDALPPGASLHTDSPQLIEELRALSRGLDADLAVYRRGILLGSGSSALEDLGFLSPVMDPVAYHKIVIDLDPGATTPGPSPVLAERIGFRAFRSATDDGEAVLASPQAARDVTLAGQELDLAFALLLTAIVGMVAALVGARAAARALSRPVSDLRDAALAFGQDQQLVPPKALPPVEFEPMFAAFRKMADDIRASRAATERAARVLAWGEMASQVAHEVKNPLTPIRLGLQHLLRVYRDRPERFAGALEETSQRMLGEIDRLDTIARAFSRYGAPAAETQPLEGVDLSREAEEVAQLYGLSSENAWVGVEVMKPIRVAARKDEVKEVLLNLLENSRGAHASHVTIRCEGAGFEVRDDGLGIPADLLPRIFEPRFSTTTSGSGLGLPIVRRLVESWGGTVTVESKEGFGTRVRVQLERFAPGPASPRDGP